MFNSEKVVLEREEYVQIMLNQQRANLEKAHIVETSNQQIKAQVEVAFAEAKGQVADCKAAFLVAQAAKYEAFVESMTMKLMVLVDQVTKSLQPAQINVLPGAQTVLTK